MRGRFAPSPTGPLHLGNLRTALVSWLHARSLGGEWWVRMEDLDRVTSSAAHEADQLASLAALGMRPDGEVVRQSDRFDRYRTAIDTLAAQGRVYECYCTRREIRDAPQAPHGELPEGSYPGTCRTLTAAQRAAHHAAGRTPALRLRTEGERFVVDDLVAGPSEGGVDDVVLQRADGVPAYNLAVVVDDAAQGVTHVVRGDDLLPSTPRQRLLQELLGLPAPRYAHVPLVLAHDGTRLAKRHGAVTLADLAAHGIGAAAVLAHLGASLGLCATSDTVSAGDLAERFRLERIPRSPWRLPPSGLLPTGPTGPSLPRSGTIDGDGREQAPGS
jgi:glutamyl-tRNA synthetase